MLSPLPTTSNNKKSSCSKANFMTNHSIKQKWLKIQAWFYHNQNGKKNPRRKASTLYTFLPVINGWLFPAAHIKYLKELSNCLSYFPQVDICLCTHTHTHTHKRAQIYTCANAWTHTHTHTHIHMYIQRGNLLWQIKNTEVVSNCHQNQQATANYTSKCTQHIEKSKQKTNKTKNKNKTNKKPPTQYSVMWLYHRWIICIWLLQHVDGLYISDFCNKLHTHFNKNFLS